LHGHRRRCHRIRLRDALRQQRFWASRLRAAGLFVLFSLVFWIGWNIATACGGGEETLSKLAISRGLEACLNVAIYR